MRRAAEEVRYLVNRGYPKGPAIRFVSDHHCLPKEHRFVLARVIVAERLAQSRRAKRLGLEAILAEDVFVDGYNVLITTECLLAGYAVYLCDDGFLRDTQGIFKGYRATAITTPALHMILALLAEAAPSRVEVLLDQQMSRSGELAGSIRDMMEGLGLPGRARTARDVDHLLKGAGAVVATSDGNVIDSIEKAIDLPAEIARRQGVRLLRVP